jgi:hypothetical protein
MVSFLESQGFTILRTLRIGTLRGILRDIELSAQDFERLWQR